MLDLTGSEEEAMAARRDDRDEFVRRLLAARCPEVSAREIEIAFGVEETVDGEAFADSADNADNADSAEDHAEKEYTAAVLVEIADAVADAIEALEERLSELERGLPWRAH